MNQNRYYHLKNHYQNHLNHPNLTNLQIYPKFHSKDNHFTLIYYINESDGGTEFKDVKIPHVANSGILLKSKDSHKNIESSVPRRISVAWIIVGELI